MSDVDAPWEPPLAGTEAEHASDRPVELYARWDDAVERRALGSRKRWPTAAWTSRCT